jgi:riboflavin synthase
MFTGLVETVGQVAAVEQRGGDRRFVVRAPGGFLDGAVVGDSIAVNGVCFTAVALDGDNFTVDASVETLNATAAGLWQEGTAVNLERALTLARPLGGHLMTGHVDGVGRLTERVEDARSWRLTLELPVALGRYIARKGSVAVDGVSLTVNAVKDVDDGARTRFSVNIVPHTWDHTTLSGLNPGDEVNIEVDLIARYLERLSEAGRA